MDNIRFALLCALGVLGFMLFQAWQADYGTSPDKTKAVQQATAKPSAASGNGQGSDVPSLASAPQIATQQSGTSKQSAQASTGTVQASAQGKGNKPPLSRGNTIHVVTDEMSVLIDLKGGDLRRVSLKQVALSADKPKSSMNLINDSPPNFFIVQSGLSGQAAPDHDSLYHAQQQTYRLQPGQETLRVPLTWTNGEGHKVVKVFIFHRGSYRIGLKRKVINNSDSPWKVSQYVRFWRTPTNIQTSIPFASPFFGVGWYEAASEEGNSYTYQTRGNGQLDTNPLAITQQGGWIAMLQHYFLGAVIPPSDIPVKFVAKPKPLPGVSPNAFAAGFISAPTTVAPGEQAKLHATLFIGPKLQDQLGAVAPGLNLTVDYGWFTILAKPLFWVLEKLHMLVGNWGVAIILLTLLIKALFYKLSEKQFRAMARMRKFAPRMKQLKEKYGDDKQKLQAKMMELYKKEGFNPMAGCWPMLVQMPVFIGLYWMLRGAVELRLESFLWLPDLTSPDPYYILPLIFGVTMFLQQRLQSNVTMDPIQQRMMQIMPIGMAVFFAFFPSGLVLYYCTNTILSILQQWYIYRKLDNEGLGHSAPTK